MNRLDELFGSKTRGKVLEALATSDVPLTAYRVAKRYNMNVAKVYKEMKRLTALGMLRADREGASVVYRLADRDLKSLALRLSSRVQTYSSWRSRGSKRERFLMGLQAVPKVDLEPGQGEDQAPRRAPGELENLAVLGRRKFDAKYRRVSGQSYDRLR